jgi:biopolymer transport protein ExbB/TolQ
MQIWLLVVISVAEAALFVLLLRFFARLKKSAALLLELSAEREELMDKLRANAEFERELMQSFAVRQAELSQLNASLEARAETLRGLLEQAESVSRSPQFLRELILKGKKRGRTPAQLAKSVGLSLDEVELILAQAEK